MANICLCGCGESLPEGSTRQYKRGHKPKVDNPSEGFVETPIGEDGFTELPLTIEDAARDTPDDPEPKDQPELKPKTVIRVTAALRRDVEGKLAFAFALGGQMWAMADPTCGAVFMQQTPEIAKKLTPIVCQSPDVVKWLTKSSNFILWIDLFMAFWPVVQIVFAHHIVKTMAGSLTTPNGQTPAPNEYVVS